MKKRLVILVSGSVLALTACNKNDNATGNAGSDANLAMNNSMAADNGIAANEMAEAGPMTAQGFTNTAAAGDRFEIESSKLAASSAKSAAVKSFATKMISAHTSSTAKLKGIVGGMNPSITPHDTLTAEQQSTLDSLKGKTGADFDTVYVAVQVDAHQKTLDALKNYAASGDNPQLKEFASGMVPTVTAHLNMAKALK